MEKYSYPSGYFLNKGESIWEEWQNGRLAFRFKETKRDAANITLGDASRNIWVLLPVGGGQSYYAYGGGASWTPLYNVKAEGFSGQVQGEIPVSPPAGGGGASAAPRLRLSAWVPNPAAALGEVSAGTSWRLVRDDRVQRAARRLDDFSAVATAMWQDGGVTWSSPGCLPGWPETDRIAVCRDAVQACHASGIQVLAGYEYVDGISAGSAGGAKFAAWLEHADDAALANHADAIIGFLWDHIGADWDGVGFDVELAALKAEHADAFVRFYTLLAERLRQQGNKVLTIATGISATIKDGTAVASEAHSLGCNRAQPFRAAVGQPNVVIRPMTYDGGPSWHSRLRDWQQAVIDYAIGTVGLTSAQLQLGVKVIGNSQYWDPGKGLVKAPNTYCCLTNPSDVSALCTGLLRPESVGLITFAGTGHPDQWNAALNPGSSPANTPGHPLQVPLGSPLA